MEENEVFTIASSFIEGDKAIELANSFIKAKDELENECMIISHDDIFNTIIPNQEDA